MIPNHTIDQYKSAVLKHLGEKVSLYLKRGRKMIVINDCILKNAYKSIFVVETFGESLLKESKISVSYADLLIGNARIIVNKDAKMA